MLNDNKQHVHLPLLVWVTVFSIAMAYVESAVVVYLRMIYYPNGFAFPLTSIRPDMAATEFFREAATMVMLASIGILAGKNSAQRFAWFLFSFGVWDIFYYVFLKLLLNWPESLLTWDILFLIPIPWVGPVVTPVIVALTMITLALLLMYFSRKPNIKEFGILGAGALLLLLSWMWDYSRYVLDKNTFSALWSLSKDDLFSQAQQYMPQRFHWGLFMAGELVCLAGIGWYYFRMKKILR